MPWRGFVTGMLGIGSADHYVDDPVLVTHFDAGKLIVQVASGLSHSAALASDGEARAPAVLCSLLRLCVWVWVGPALLLR